VNATMPRLELALLLLAGAGLARAQEPVVHVSGRAAPFHACVAQGGAHAATFWSDDDLVVLFDLETQRDYAYVRTDGGIQWLYFAAGGTRLVAVTERTHEVHDLTGRRLQQWRIAAADVQETEADAVLEFRMATHALVTARTVRRAGATRLVVERADGSVTFDQPGEGFRLSASGERVWWAKGRTILVHDTRTGAVVTSFDIAATSASESGDLSSALLEVARDDRMMVIPELVARDDGEWIAALRWCEGDKQVAEWPVPEGTIVDDYFFASDGALAISAAAGDERASMLRWLPSEGAPKAVDWPADDSVTIDFDSGIHVAVPMAGGGQLAIAALSPARAVSAIQSQLAGCTWLVDAGSGELFDFDGSLVRRWDLGSGRRQVVGRQWISSPVATLDGLMLARDGQAVILARAAAKAREPVPGLVDDAQIAVGEGMQSVAVATHERFWTARIVASRFEEARSCPRPPRPSGAAEAIDGAVRCAQLGASSWLVADDLGRVELWSSAGECRQLGTFPELVAPPVPEFRAQQPAVEACSRREDGSVLLLAGGRLWRLDPQAGTLQLAWEAAEGIDGCAFAPDGSIAVALGDEIRLFDARLNETKRLASRHDSWRRLHFARGGRQLLCATESVAMLWNLPTGDGPFTLVPIRDGTAAIVAPSGHWAAPRSALPALTVRRGDRGYPAESFDVVQNRPDLVLAQLGVADAAVIERAGRRVRSRWAELGHRPDATGGTNPPTLAWVQRPPRVTAATEVAFRVKATAGSAPLQSWRVRADNVPIHELRGRPVASRDADEVEFVVPLRHGANQLDVEVVDVAGRRSLPLQFSLVREGNAPSPRLFVLAIGVSDYRDDTHDLHYAASDAARLCSQLQASWPGECRVQPLVDKAADRQGILAAASFLQQANVDDVALVFFAGHGLVAEDAGYVFAPHDLDFARPGATGVRFAEIEALLHATPARRRIVLLDTCRAGRLQAEQAKPVALSRQPAMEDGRTAPAETGEARGAGGPPVRLLTRGIDPELPAGSAAAAEDPMEALADLGDGVGATMLAASGGAEYALEIGAMRGGLFTTAVCDGLAFLSADRNHDLAITVGEWMQVAQRHVITWSNGAQVPGLRRDNLQFDVVLARATPAVAWGDSLDDFEVEDWAVSDDGTSVLMFGDQGALLRTRPDGSVRWRIAGPEGGYHSGEFLRDGTIVLSASEPNLTFVDPKDGSVLATSDLFCFTPRSLGCDGAEASVFPAAIFGTELDVWRGGKLRRLQLGSLFAGGLQVVDVLFAPEGLSATLLGMSGELVQWNFADDSRRVVGRVRLPDGLAPNGEPLARRLSPSGRYVLGDRDEEGGGRLFVWTAEDGKLVADRRVPAGRLAVLLPDGLVEIHAGDREVGVDPIQVLDPLSGTSSFGRWFEGLDHASGVLELPDAWVQPVGAGGFVFVRPPNEPSSVEDLSASSEESLLVFDARSEARLAWLRMSAKEREPGRGDEWISPLDLVGTARFVASRGVVVWVTRSGRVFEWSIAER
jgi:hypothetical protein